MTASNSFITRTSNGCPTDHLPVRGGEKHDSADSGSRTFRHVQKDSFVPTRETPAHRAERLAVIARLRCIYPEDFISATYGGDHV